VATLPADNSNDYAGLTCVLSGWGRTSKNADILFINYIGTINRHEITMLNIKRPRLTHNIITRLNHSVHGTPRGRSRRPSSLATEDLRLLGLRQFSSFREFSFHFVTIALMNANFLADKFNWTHTDTESWVKNKSSIMLN